MIRVIGSNLCGTCGKALAILEQQDLPFSFHDYLKTPLSSDEIRTLLKQLGLSPQELVRKREANKVGLTGQESEDELINMMASNGRLLQRPIVVRDDVAIVARPADTLLEWL